MKRHGRKHPTDLRDRGLLPVADPCCSWPCARAARAGEQSSAEPGPRRRPAAPPWPSRRTACPRPRQALSDKPLVSLAVLQGAFRPGRVRVQEPLPAAGERCERRRHLRRRRRAQQRGRWRWRLVPGERWLGLLRVPHLRWRRAARAGPAGPGTSPAPTPAPATRPEPGGRHRAQDREEADLRGRPDHPRPGKGLRRYRSLPKPRCCPRGQPAVGVPGRRRDRHQGRLPSGREAQVQEGEGTCTPSPDAVRDAVAGTRRGAHLVHDERPDLDRCASTRGPRDLRGQGGCGCPRSSAAARIQGHQQRGRKPVRRFIPPDHHRPVSPAAAHEPPRPFAGRDGR